MSTPASFDDERPSDQSAGRPGDVIPGNFTVSSGGTADAHGEHGRQDRGTGSGATGSADEPRDRVASEGPRYLKAEPLRPGPGGRGFPRSPGGFTGPGGYRGRSPFAGGPGGFTVHPFGTGTIDPSDLKLKNPFLAGGLGLVFGPLGLFYATIPWAAALLIVTVAIISANWYLLLPFVWLTCAVIGFGAAIRHNARAMIEAVTEASRQDPRGG